MKECLTSPWLACINGKEQACRTFYEACDVVMKYIGNQKLTKKLYDCMWVECGGEVINIYLVSRIVQEAG